MLLLARLQVTGSRTTLRHARLVLRDGGVAGDPESPRIPVCATRAGNAGARSLAERLRLSPQLERDVAGREVDAVVGQRNPEGDHQSRRALREVGILPT